MADLDKVEIFLKPSELDNVTLWLGMIAGLFAKQGEWSSFYRVISTINSIHRNNPNYRPYEIPPQHRERA